MRRPEQSKVHATVCILRPRTSRGSFSRVPSAGVGLSAVARLQWDMERVYVPFGSHEVLYHRWQRHLRGTGRELGQQTKFMICGPGGRKLKKDLSFTAAPNALAALLQDVYQGLGCATLSDASSIVAQGSAFPEASFSA